MATLFSGPGERRFEKVKKDECNILTDHAKEIYNNEGPLLQTFLLANYFMPAVAGMARYCFRSM